MLKKSYIFLLLLIMGIGYLSAQTLTVRVENVDVGNGYLMIGVFIDEDTFPNSSFRGERVGASNRTMEVVFTDLPIGQYAISVYQDSNDNGQLDTNIFGIPKERYGFTNGARRPNFRQSLFTFNETMSITIQIR